MVQPARISLNVNELRPISIHRGLHLTTLPAQSMVFTYIAESRRYDQKVVCP